MNTNKLQNILVATDFSDCAFNAINTAIVIAARHQANLILLEVTTALPASNKLSIDRIISEQHEAALSKSVLRLTKTAKEINDQHLVTTSSISKVGLIAEQICETAKEINADMIVMGTHGASSLKEFFIGSNSFAVIEKAEHPVLIIPQATTIVNFKRIMFPVRNIPNALEKYNFLRTIIKHNNSELIVFGVEKKVDNAINNLTDSINYFNNQMKDDNVINSTFFKVGDKNLADEVMQKAKEMGCDLIVITSKLDTNFKEYFIGTFSQQIVNRSQIPVLHIK